MRWHNAGLTDGGSAAATAEGPRIVPSAPAAATRTPSIVPAAIEVPGDRAFEGHLGPGRLTTIVSFLHIE